MNDWIKYTTEGEDYITPDRWGKDHWSTLAYLETRMVDHEGRIDNRHMRCNPRLHRSFAHVQWDVDDKYPTKLKDGEINNHDDWSCLEDMVAAGMLEAWFQGGRAKVRFTSYGLVVAAALRKHKAQGGTFGSFGPDEIVKQAAA